MEYIEFIERAFYFSVKLFSVNFRKGFCYLICCSSFYLKLTVVKT